MAPKSPQDCGTLDDVRAAIDDLDRQIVTLMASRADFVARAADFKSSTAEVEAPKRVEQVIAKIHALAGAAGLPPAVGEATYRAMIGAFIAYEKSVHSGR